MGTATRQGRRAIDLTLNIILLIFVAATGIAAVWLRNLLASTIPEPVTETLCRQVVSFNLRYFDGSAWHDSWDSTTNDNALPAAVEVQLSILRPDSETIYKMTRLFPIPSQSPESQGGVEILRGGSS